MRKSVPVLLLSLLTVTLAAPPMNRAASSFSHPSARTPLTVSEGQVTAFNPDDGTLVTFAGNSQPSVLQVPGKWAWKPQTTPQGLLAAQLDFPRCRVVLWNLMSRKTGAILQGDFRETFACGKDGTGFLFRSAFTPDGKFFLAVDGHTLRRWDARTGKLLDTRSGFWDSLNVSPDGKTVALLNRDRRIELWTGDLKRRLKASPPQPASCLNIMGAQVNWSGDSRLAAFSCRDEVRIWNAQQGGIQSYRRARTVEAPDAPVFSPDSRYVVTGEAQHGLTVWKVGNEVAVNIFSLETSGVQVTSVALTKNNVVLAALSDGKLLHLEQGRLKSHQVFNAGKESLWPSLTVNSQGTWFALTDGRGKVMVMPLPLPDDMNAGPPLSSRRSRPLTISMPLPPCMRGAGFILDAPHRTGETESQYQTRIRKMLLRHGIADVEFYGPPVTGFYLRGISDVVAGELAWEPEISTIMANQLCPAPAP